MLPILLALLWTSGKCMPSWDDAVGLFVGQAPEDRANWLQDQLRHNLQLISGLRAERNVVLYSSAFLQKPAVPGFAIAVSTEDMNGAMTSLHGLDCARGLTLILHTPGGDIGGAQALMSYLHTKFEFIEVIVPTYAMSAGTMMALGSHNVVMGRQSQLGPIDAQIFTGSRQVSAGAVLSQFEVARQDILNEPRSAHYWHPILQSMGPALHQEAKYALEYGQSLVTQWLRQRMCADRADPAAEAAKIANYFNTTDQHKHHGRRIDREECRAKGVTVEDLEPNQPLQEAVLTLYHYMTLFFETGSATKLWMNNQGRHWVKHHVIPA